jgi:hypothetical protein
MGIGYADQATNLYDLNIRDSQDYVNGDYYNEQTLNNLDLDGGAAAWPGRVTLQAFKQQDWSNSVAVTVNNYNGWCFYGPQAFANIVNFIGAPSYVYAPVKITQTGTNAFTLILPVDNFFAEAPVITTNASCHLIQMLNQAIATNYTTFTVLPDTPSPLTGADYASISSGLDHLRQLGLEDLKLIRGFLPATLSIELTNQEFTVTWNSAPGATYQLQCSTNLASANWSNVLPQVTANSLTTSQTIAISGVSQQFYRVTVVIP